MILTDEMIQQLRTEFPAFGRNVNGFPVSYFDGPAGTQVPQAVVQAMSHYLFDTNANHKGLFQTAVESDQMLASAHQAFADFLGADDPTEISFGQNMTSLTLAFSRAISKEWKEGDEIIVTRLDHDANVTPWVLAAKDQGVKVNYVEFNLDDFKLDLQQLESYLNAKTRLIAVGCASNASGGINPVSQICEMAHSAGALCYVDAVHYAPHRLIDVKKLGCDFLVCSAYKFFGPHTGIFWGKRELMERIEAYKVRPSPGGLPGKWMTGTQSHESISGSMAAVDYIAGIGRNVTGQQELSRREALFAAFNAIESYEQVLSDELLRGFATVPGIQVYGIREPGRGAERVSTFSVTLDGMETINFARQLCERGHFVWHGNYYALQFSETLGLEPEGMVRIGTLHYNTAGEVERLLQDIHVIASSKLA
jgi:cysteine desulfurase family protein (TIGR01976 family)